MFVMDLKEFRQQKTFQNVSSNNTHTVVINLKYEFCI